MIHSVFYVKVVDAIDMGTASIAVLTLVDMSPQQNQSYFSEELRNVLANVKDLKIAGRTSFFRYKGQNDNLINN